MSHTTIDTSAQAPMPMVQLLQLFSMASHYFGWKNESTTQTTLMPDTNTDSAWESENYPKTTVQSKLSLERIEKGRQLLEAVKMQNLTLTRALLNQGADLDVQDKEGLTALHWAAVSDHVAFMPLLLNNSADPNAHSYLDNTPMHRAARTGNTPACRYLLQYGANLNATNSEGNTPLHEAARWGRTSVVELLISVNADLSALNNWGRTPSEEAASNRRSKVHRLLQDAIPTSTAISNNETQPIWFRVDTNTSLLKLPAPERPTQTTVIRKATKATVTTTATMATAVTTFRPTSTRPADISATTTTDFSDMSTINSTASPMAINSTTIKTTS